MTTILKRLSRAASARKPLRVTFDASKREPLGEKVWRGDTPTHYRANAPLPNWLAGSKD